MSRKIENKVHKYFTYDDFTNTSMCNVDQCNCEINEKHAGNLIKHIQSKHSKFYMEHFTKIKEVLSINNLEKYNLTHKSVLLEINEKELIGFCVEAVTVYGHSLSNIKENWFKKIFETILNKLNSKFTLNNINLKKKILEKFIENLQLILSNKYISLKLDGVSRLGKSMIGINAQFYSKGEK